MSAQEKQDAYEWGGYDDGARAGGQKDEGHKLKFTTNLNRKFFGAGAEPEQQAEVGHGRRSPRRGGMQQSPRDRPLPMLLSPRYAQRMVADGGMAQEWADEELWKAEPENCECQTQAISHHNLMSRVASLTGCIYYK